MKTFQRILLCLIACGYALHTRAQASLSIEEIKELNARSFELKYKDPDSAKLLAREAWRASKQIDHLEGEARALSRLAYAFSSQPDSSLKYFQESLDFRQKNGLGNLGMALMYKRIGYVYKQKDMYEQAIGNFEEGLKLVQGLDHQRQISDFHRRLAEVYEELAVRKIRAKDSSASVLDQNLAIRYGKASINSADKTKYPAEYANSCLLISSVYRMGRNYDSTIQYIDQAIYIYDSLTKATDLSSHKGVLANAYTRKGRMYNDLKRYEQGLAFHIKAADISRVIKDTLSLFVSLINAGDSYLQQKKYTQALKTFDEAMEISPDESANKELLRILNNNMATVQEAMGNHDKALPFLRKSLELNTAIFVESSDAQIRDATENIKLEAEKEQILIEKDFQTQLNYWLLIGGLVVTALLSIILWNSNQKRKFQKIIIENQEATHMNKLLSQLEEAEQQILSDQSAKQQMLLTAIGKELHDSIGSMLSAAKREMENLRNSLTDIPAKAEGQFDHSYGMVDKAIRDLRKISKSPDKLSLDEQLVPSLRELCKNINRIENSPHIELNTYRLEGVKLPAKHELHIFRIIQEAITNIIKHAQATEVHMQLDWANRILSITIEDNGKGFDPKKIKHGVGLDSMRSRTEELNGTFTLDTAPGKGSTLFMEISIPG